MKRNSSRNKRNTRKKTGSVSRRTRPSAVLGYSLNVFPDETTKELWRTLRDQAIPIQRESFESEPFPIEMRLSGEMACELTADAAQRKRLSNFLQANSLEIVTLNAFVPLSFHEANVKEKVYLPRWDEGRERLAYTLACADLLAELGSSRAPYLSLSVPAGILKRDLSATHLEQSAAAFAVALARFASHAHQLWKRTKRWCVLALEAEPGLTCERTDELIEFFQTALDVYGAGWLAKNESSCGSLDAARRLLRQFIGINFDTCHQLVEGEDLRLAVQLIRSAGISIFKVHVSNCLLVRNPSKRPKEVKRLKNFYSQSKFLHQTTSFRANGSAFVLDLPAAWREEHRRAFFGSEVRELRVHYHMPLLPDSGSATMLEEVRAFLRWFARSRSGKCPLIIETYTWLEQLRADRVKKSEALRRNIVREIAEVRRWI